jgi:hypothetical protein
MPEKDVVSYGERQRIWALKDHADMSSQLNELDFGMKDIVL